MELTPFSRTFAVRPEDVDVQGHVNNQVYVRWVEELAVAHSEAVGLDHDAYARRGALFVVRRQEIDYLGLLRGDDTVLASTWLEEARGVQCVRRSEFRRASDGKLVAAARTLWVYLDAVRGRPTKIGADVRAAFGQPAAR